VISYTIIPIKSEHDLRISQIIQAGGREFGAIGDGFGPSDSEVTAMSHHYPLNTRSGYFVALTTNEELLGGAGIAPLGTYSDICELKKLYLLPEARGYGIGEALTRHCLTFAQQLHYRHTYLDTLSTMNAAIQLYKKLGFQQLSAPLEGATHSQCDIWMMKTLPNNNKIHA